MIRAVTLTEKQVDVPMLRRQRDMVLDILANSGYLGAYLNDNVNILDGVVNLFDFLLDGLEVFNDDDSDIINR